MAELAEQRNPETPLEQAKALILKDLGLARVARWCGVGEAAVYQWLVRGTDERPIPPDFVPPILAGAKAAGMSVPLTVLMPAMAGLV